MDMEWNYLFFTVFGVLGIFVIISLFFRPFKLLINVIRYAVFGLLSLLLLNILLKSFDMHIAINPFTVLLAGALKVPGIILLIICQYLFI